MSNDLSEDPGTLDYNMIENELIVGFNLWGERRICLPQLLRFVLSEFDINVIDQAVTDLRINCFPCNSQQIQLLHDNNIFPKQIVRCGLIRKSDAERLCKYLLQPNQNFNSLSETTKKLSKFKSIEVVHTCFGEQRGTLYPVLYDSSDAKCIKCSTCENFFKTFEFVGHTHKLDEVSNTFHWGFDSNNWRLLLQIYTDVKVTNVDYLNEMKSILDKVKILFYEDEMRKRNQSNMNIIWRPSRKFKLPNPPKSHFNSPKPAHLRDGLAEVYRKSLNQGLNISKFDAISSNFVPNVYLQPPDGNIGNVETSNDDDDIEDFDECNEKSLKCSNDPAMNAALQIKKESINKDLLSLGTISSFLNKNDYSILNNNNNNEKSNNKFTKQESGPVIVAQSATSIPPQFLMLEALWSQLFRDIIQLTHLVHFNTNDDRNHIVGQLIRCQDLFRTQWADLAEENQTLKEKLLQEQKQRHEIESLHDKMSISLKELTMEKCNLREIIKQLESECELLRSEIKPLVESGHLKDSPIKNESQKNSSDIGIEVYNWCRAGCKRHFSLEESDHHHSNNVCSNDIGGTADSIEKVNSFKQMRQSNDNVLVGNGVMDVNDNFVVVASTNNNCNNNNNNHNESL